MVEQAYLRRKYFAMHPMSVDQARYQLELIDHDFYLFRDKEARMLRIPGNRHALGT